MAVKLYPPVIEGALPAFYGTETLSVPFSMNRAVGVSEVAGFALKIKTVSGIYLTTLKTVDTASFDLLNETKVDFNISGLDKPFTVGQYYKVQLAYIDAGGQVGIFSTVGVIKYTTKPSVSLQNFDFGQINQHNYTYVGVYSQEGATTLEDGQVVKRDSTEKMYSCRFTIQDDMGLFVYDSGYIIHNTAEDDLSYEAHESCLIAQDLDINRSYYARFWVRTNNGLEESSQKYRVMQRRSISPEITVDLIAELDYDNGFVNIRIADVLPKDPVISGTFLISRAASNTGYVWEEFRRFDLQSVVPNKWHAVDCTVEQGVTYKYSLQQYNANKIYSDRIISNAVYADFEDSFLYDGDKQLRIRFNPKVSSFKNTVMETKVDTIGSQHPFILRNGNVNYREFPISGLISYQMDSSHLFMPEEDLALTEKSFDLTGDNIKAERMFKLKALEWLTDGKAKLFRSPTEGNYIVRLLNSSLTPTDSVGRMLHTFNCTAYEIAKCTTENLEYYGLIDSRENLTAQTRWVTIDIQEKGQSSSGEDNDLITLNDKQFYSLQFMDMRPGVMVYLDGISIQIGATGAYSVASEKPFTRVQIAKKDMTQGLVTYSYKSKIANVFGMIEKVHIEDVPIQQHIGAYPITAPGLKNYLASLEDIKTEVLHIAFMRFKKREARDIFINVSYEDYFNHGSEAFDYTKPPYVFFEDMDCLKPVVIEDLDPLCLYQLRFRRSDYRFYYQNKKDPSIYLEPFIKEDHLVDRTSPYFAPYTKFYYDPCTTSVHEITPHIYDIVIDGEIVNIAETGEFFISDTQERKPDLRLYPGIITEISYSKQIITYSFESSDENVKTAKINYENTLSQYRTDWNGGNKATIKLPNKSPSSLSDEQLSRYRNQVNYMHNTTESYYRSFIARLNTAINDYKEANGIV